MTVRAYIALGVLALILALGFTGYAYRQAYLREHAKTQTAVQQAQNNQASAQAVDRVYRETTVIHDKAQAAVQQIQAAPHASDPLPPDVLAGFAAGVDGLRQHDPAQPSRP